MDRPGAERRLAAILAADMVGFSRLMEADEEGTLARLKTHRMELIDPAIARFGGRIIKTTGDGLLIEFPSVVDAVSCAVEVQSRMARRNRDVDADRRMEFRVGINLGDVIVDGDDILGDGVNVAARLEQLAEPGGICVSGAVMDQVRARLDIEAVDLGEHTVKNITRPLPVFRIVIRGLPSQNTAVSTNRLVDAEKPSIGVLPFVNMSGDPEQEFFADGITEDIIAALSRFRDLVVISRNSTFTYKGRAVPVSEFAEALKVQFVVEGSVRKAGDRVRITVQLIDAERDQHVWAERYDRRLEDIFDIQDEVTAAIVATLPGRIEAATQERAARKPSQSMAAYELFLAGKVLHHRSTADANRRAIEMLDNAIELDPGFAQAHAWRACTLGQSWVHGWCDNPEATWNQVLEELATALALDDNDSDVHRILAAVNLTRGDHDKAKYHQERAIGLNPNDDLIVVQQGELLTWQGRPEEGIEWILKAMRLNPYHPERFWNHLGRAYFVARRYAEAVDAFRRIQSPDHTHMAFIAAASARLGDDDSLQRAVAEVRRRDPSFSVSSYMETLHYARDEDREHHRDCLLAAGFPP